ncbi:MAG TPA: FecR domain-containing protein, partial [Chitinivibrionales bacterium]|nr:FecR domain-containing protein [Chitinivibrionales bacterium]
MKCNVTERQVYLLCDGLLDKEQRAAVEAHVAGCERCGRVYREARATLALLKRPAPADSCFDAAAARASIERGLAAGSPAPRVLEFPLKKPSLRFLAAAAVLVFAAVASMYYAFGLQTGNHALPPAAARASQDGAIFTSTRDSIVVFDRMCALKVCPNSSVSISRPERRVVHFDLARGIVLIAAHKRLYDTIAVRCGAVTAVATGTHFSVDRTNGEVRVSVIEGTVTVH